MNGPTKRPFLAVYDYGMGGVWLLIDATSQNQVVETYPRLKVPPARPTWMDDEAYAEIEGNMHFNIDAPTGWLLNLERSE